MATGVAVGVILAAVGGDDAVWLAAVTVLLAASLAVSVPVPWGGDVPLGYALAAALAALPAPELVLPLAVLMVALGTCIHRRGRPGLTAVARMAPACLAALPAVALLQIYRGDGVTVLEQVVVASVAVLGVDALAARWLAPAGARPDLARFLPIYLTLGCGATLIAVATSGFGVVMAAVAALPLLITRFSFQRYAHAGETLRQTVQALGLVPELAGLAPLGHSERAAHYAAAVGEELGLNQATVERVVTATRLHHLGAVPYDPVNQAGQEAEPPGPEEVAAQGAVILREAGFPEDVAALVEAAKTGALDGDAVSLEAAAVRVAAAFDEVVGEDASATARGLALVSATAHDSHTRRAVGALLELTGSRPTLVAETIATGTRFSEAAAGLDLEGLVVSRVGAQLLPFARPLRQR